MRGGEESLLSMSTGVGQEVVDLFSQEVSESYGFCCHGVEELLHRDYIYRGERATPKILRSSRLARMMVVVDDDHYHASSVIHAYQRNIGWFQLPSFHPLSHSSSSFCGAGPHGSIIFWRNSKRVRPTDSFCATAKYDN